MRLRDTIAIVTEPATPIGGAIAAALRREGAIVESPEGAAADGTAAVVATHGRIDAIVATSADALEWCTAAAPHLVASGGGSITTIVTVRALAGDARRGDEARTGGAVVAGTRALATELGKLGVRANTIAVPPSDLDVEVLRRSTLLDRAMRPDDVAALAVFLASGDASFVTGQVLGCDGGLLAHLPHYAALLESGATTTKR